MSVRAHRPIPDADALPWREVRPRRPLDSNPEIGLAGGSADLAAFTALAPWLCVTAFRRVCSEQRMTETVISAVMAAVRPCRPYTASPPQSPRRAHPVVIP